MLRIDGEVQRPLVLSFDDLQRLGDEYQVRDVSRLAGGRPGDAVRLAGLLSLAGVLPQASYLGLHSARDDFHASVPLAAVADRALVIYRWQGQPLPVERGGPVRFFIPEHAACHAEEVDECANVKFVDRIELTCGKGFDNRPQDEAEHQRLHEDPGA